MFLRPCCTPEMCTCDLLGGVQHVMLELQAHTT
jgi:hypothetical protein